MDFLRITNYRLIEPSYMKEQMWRVCYFLIKRKKLLQQPDHRRTLLNSSKFLQTIKLANLRILTNKRLSRTLIIKKEI